jgi:DNA sulfur modification protein DndB
MVMMPEHVRQTFPALRCVMGDWVYYITYLTFADVSYWIKKTDQIHKSENLRDMIQRQLSSRATPIADYLVNQKERFFNSIVVGVYGGAPQWYPVEVGDSPTVEVELDEESSQSIGLLMLDGAEDLFAIDGQHRVEAIKQALKNDPTLSGEELSVVFVSHQDSPAGKLRTRRLFSTLNRYAKPVSKGEIVALDEDDAFAIVTRRLVEDFPLLKGFVFFGKTAPLSPSDNKHLTSILAIYEICQAIFIPIIDRKAQQKYKSLKILRPSDQILEQVYDLQVLYWETLKKYFPEYEILFSSESEEKLVTRFRSQAGGHLMFRPAGQIAFARAVRISIDRGATMEEAVSKLSSLPMNIGEPPWQYVLWDPSTRKITRVSPLLPESVLLYLVQQEPRTRKFDTLEEYRKVVNNARAILLPTDE